MARPPKVRIFEGVTLPANLYPDPAKRPGYWLYIRKDGTKKIFQADAETAARVAHEANNTAQALTEAAATAAPARDSVARFVEEFISYRERMAPKLKQKESWKNYQGYLRGFARDFAGVPVYGLELRPIVTWWEKLTAHAQRSRRAEFNKFFNWLAVQELTPKLKSNPFSTADDKPRVILKPIDESDRERLDLDAYWTIYAKAGEMGWHFLQVAMGVSLVTTWRRGDVCALRFDQHITGDHIGKAISKSHEKLGTKSGANLRWSLKQQADLADLIRWARELSMLHGRCPFVLSMKPERRVMGQGKAHWAQVLPRRLSDAFTECRDAAGVFNHLPPDKRPTFHAVRALASHLYKVAGYDVEAVQTIMAHTDREMTEHYQAGHAVVWTDVDLVLPRAVLGRGFR